MTNYYKIMLTRSCTQHAYIYQKALSIKEAKEEGFARVASGESFNWDIVEEHEIDHGYGTIERLGQKGEVDPKNPFRAYHLPGNYFVAIVNLPTSSMDINFLRDATTLIRSLGSPVSEDYYWDEKQDVLVLTQQGAEGLLEMIFRSEFEPMAGLFKDALRKELSVGTLV